jgi:hypothetical protein
VRWLANGEGVVMEAGRFVSVLHDLRRVGESLSLTVETEKESGAAGRHVEDVRTERVRRLILILRGRR